jgi:hypothetical protein
LRLGAGRQYKVSQDATLNVEVTSESTAEIDRREKLVAYQKLPGLRAYWIASQDTQRVEAHERDASGRWQAMAYGCGEALPLSCIDGKSMSLATLYAGRATRCASRSRSPCVIVAPEPSLPPSAGASAIALSPMEPSRFLFDLLQAAAKLASGKFDEAAECARISLRRNAMHVATHRLLVIALSLSDRSQEASVAARSLLRLERRSASAGSHNDPEGKLNTRPVTSRHC